MPNATSKPFDLGSFIATVSPGKFVSFRKKQIIFSQGERSDSLYYIEEGIVKLSVTSKRGKEAIIGVFGRGELFGESSIASDRPVRFHNAVALTDMRVVKIRREEMALALGNGINPAYPFVAYLLRRNARILDDLVNNLLGSSEERLARVLSFLPREPSERRTPKLSQQDLANMIGVTRQRVNVLMKKFRKS